MFEIRKKEIENPEGVHHTKLEDSLEPEFEKALDETNNKYMNDSPESKITDAEKKQIKEETGWSDKIIDSAKSVEELNVYRNAELKEAVIEGKTCLIRDDINFEQKDEFGRSNKERVNAKLSPLNENYETVELHHIGQKQENPLAELTTQEHRGKGSDTTLHDKRKESEINRNEFAKERNRHWESRVRNL